MVEDNRNNPAYSKRVETRSAKGDLTGEVSFDVLPWYFSADGNKPAKSGVTLRVTTAKLPFGDSKGSKSYINLDMANKNLRDAIFECYQAYDKFVGDKE